MIKFTCHGLFSSRSLLPRQSSTVWMSVHQPHPSNRLVAMVPMDTALVRQYTILKRACLEGSCRPCSIYLHTNNFVLTMSPFICHWCGVLTSFELCSICKHQHDACVKAFVMLVSKQLLMSHETFLYLDSHLKCWTFENILPFSLSIGIASASCTVFWTCTHKGHTSIIQLYL